MPQTSRMARIGAVLLTLTLLLGLGLALDAAPARETGVPTGALLICPDRQPAAPAADDPAGNVESRLDAAMQTVAARLEKQAPDPVPAAGRPTARRTIGLLRTTERASALDAPAEPG